MCVSRSLSSPSGCFLSSEKEGKLITIDISVIDTVNSYLCYNICIIISRSFMYNLKRISERKQKTSAHNLGDAHFTKKVDETRHL